MENWNINAHGALVIAIHHFWFAENCCDERVKKSRCLLALFLVRKKQNEERKKDNRNKNWYEAQFLTLNCIRMITWEVENSCKIAVSTISMRVDIWLLFLFSFCQLKILSINSIVKRV